MASPTEQPEPSDGTRRVQFKNYGSWRANLLLWGIPIAFVLLVLLQNIGSGVATSTDDIRLINCEGYLWIDNNECRPWAEDVVASGIPDGKSARDIMELQIRRSLFGLIDHCTAVFVFQGGATAEKEVACR